MSPKKKDELSALRSAMIEPLPEEKSGIPSWASILLIICGGTLLLFGVVKLIKFAWYF